MVGLNLDLFDMGQFCKFLELVNLWLYCLYVIGDYCEVVS